MILSVQLKHPGHQKPFYATQENDGYSVSSNSIIRLWNNDDIHYRKFMRVNGHYINPNNELIQEDLLLWGEWEGTSIFSPLNNNNQMMPNGIHQPYHELKSPYQNTDPYIFGNNFYYAICKQRGKVCNLSSGSLILFGSAYKDFFALDTVFVVGSSYSVQETLVNSMNLSSIYKAQTIDRLIQVFYTPNNFKNKLYLSQAWESKSSYFSFVPCKPYMDNQSGFERVRISYQLIEQLSKNPTNTKYLGDTIENCKDIWTTIHSEVIRQGFKIGVKFQEPSDNSEPQNTIIRKNIAY
jgi:hypothetical protein